MNKAKPLAQKHEKHQLVNIINEEYKFARVWICSTFEKFKLSCNFQRLPQNCQLPRGLDLFQECLRIVSSKRIFHKR